MWWYVLYGLQKCLHRKGLDVFPLLFLSIVCTVYHQIQICYFSKKCLAAQSFSRWRLAVRVSKKLILHVCNYGPRNFRAVPSNFMHFRATELWLENLHLILIVLRNYCVQWDITYNNSKCFFKLKGIVDVISCKPPIVK